MKLIRLPTEGGQGNRQQRVGGAWERASPERRLRCACPSATGSRLRCPRLHRPPSLRGRTALPSLPGSATGPLQRGLLGQHCRRTALGRRAHARRASVGFRTYDDGISNIVPGFGSGARRADPCLALAAAEPPTRRAVPCPRAGRGGVGPGVLGRVARFRATCRP